MNMKISTRGALVTIALDTSVAANLYQFHELLRCMRAAERPRTFCYHDLDFNYPIDGLTPEDARQILTVFDSLEKKEPFNARILAITVHDNTHVVIETGFMKGPLSGGGRFFGFIKTEKGWVYDPKTKTSVWVS
jgi:hypothetical protein